MAQIFHRSFNTLGKVAILGLPLLLGSIGLAGSKNASKPDQARLYSWIGIVGGAGFVAVVMLLLVGSVAFGTTSLIPTFYSGGFATPTPVAPSLP